jgi:hypothetical protein
VKGLLSDRKQTTIAVSNAAGSRRSPIVLGPPSALAADPNGDYQITTGSCTEGMTLNPGDSCNLTLQFSPMALQSSQGTLTLPNNGNRGRKLAIKLRGRGVLGRLTRSPTSLNFDTMPVGLPSEPLFVTLTNSNAVPITIAPATVAGKEAAEFVVNQSACGARVPASQSCLIAVTFTPATKGTRSATLEITTGGKPSLIKVRLVGVGE